MLPFEFTVEGVPLSQQTLNRVRLQEWKAAVRAATQVYWAEERQPLAVPLQITVVHFHDGESSKIDNDNLVKPIQDALIGVVYADDRQITDLRVRKTDVNGEFRPRYMSSVLAAAFVRGAEFLYIRVEEAPDHRELL